MWALAIATVTALALASSAGARGGRPVTGFSPGHWTGTMKIEGGIDTGSTHVSGQGAGRFSFVIDPRGKVETGRISIGETIVTTDSTGTFSSYTYGGMPLMGDAVRVTGVGPMQFHIETSYGPIDGPVDAEVSLRPLTVSCRTVRGDAAIPARRLQTAFGFATNVTALFTAHRRSGSAADQRNLSRELRAARTDLDLCLGRPSSPLLAGLAADAVKDLSRAVAAASSCGSPAAGFEHGIVGQPQLAPRVTRMVTRAAENRRALGVEKLEDVLEAAVESGFTAAQTHGLVAGLEDLMLQTPLSTDPAGLRGVLRVATLYDLGELATAAQAALSKLGAP